MRRTVAGLTRGVRHEERVVGESVDEPAVAQGTSANCSSEYTARCDDLGRLGQLSASESVTAAPSRAKCSRTSARRA